MKLLKEYEKFEELYKQGFIFDPETKTVFTDKKTLPKGFEDWQIENTDLHQYANDRLKKYGITDKKNTVKLFGGVNIQNNQAVDHKIFTITKTGDIEILQYSLDAKPLTYLTVGAESTSTSNREKYHVQKRLHPFHELITGAKYDFTEAKNSPFWHPDQLETFAKADKKTNVQTLCITEGQFKAFKASMHDIPTVGLTSIAHFRQKSTGTIHTDIVDFIKKCNVQRVVILWDGDCRNLSSKAIETKDDLATRPNQFYKFASKIREMLQEFFPPKKLEVYFATIKTDEIKGNPKGIDDLLIELPKEISDIRFDFNSIGERPAKFFEWINITNETGVKKMRSFFHLDNVKAFYNFHQDRIKQDDFVFFGNTYRIEKNEPLKKIDANVKNYKRIGVDYYKIDQEPFPTGKDGELVFEEVLEPWNKQAIVDDHGKDVIKYIERFNGFTNIPSHTDYQAVIKGRWNLYHNINHTAVPGEWRHIQILLQHLFRDQYEMILDYITILYKKPQQKLPVICLVSREQKTGKSTFIYLMKLIFKQNMAMISNNDLTGDFNSHWTSKLIVASEETMLEKKEAYEKIKTFSTARHITRNEKNKAQRTIPCMVHFIFCSNHEDDFIKIDDYDSRLWIRKIESIKTQINKFDDKIEDEIPHFVDFIQNREIAYKDVGERLYFKPDDFKTDAFKNLVKNSEPAIIKELRENLIESFLKTGVPEQRMTVSQIKYKFGLHYEKNYISREIQRTLGLQTSNTSSKYFYLEGNEVKSEVEKGRCFTFVREHFVKDMPKEFQQPIAVEDELPF